MPFHPPKFIKYRKGDEVLSGHEFINTKSSFAFKKNKKSKLYLYNANTNKYAFPS